MKALLRDAMPGVFTPPTPTTDAEKQATKMDVATKGLTVAGELFTGHTALVYHMMVMSTLFICL